MVENDTTTGDSEMTHEELVTYHRCNVRPVIEREREAIVAKIEAAGFTVESLGCGYYRAQGGPSYPCKAAELAGELGVSY